MIKKKLTGFCAAAVCFIGTAGITAHAATIEEVSETARSLGFPESFVQQGINEYNTDPDFYTPEVLDEAISYLYTYEAELKAQLGITEMEPSTSPTVDEPSSQNTSSSAQTTTESGSSTGQTTTESGSSSGQNASKPSSIPNEPGESEFINMTLDEKREYISTLTPDQQQEFFSSLTPEELKSVVKQLPTGDKAEVVDTFVKAGESMGLTITVDEFSDDTLSMSMRNNNGDLVDVASLGVIVEDTGLDYRSHYAVSGILILAAAGGIWLVARKCFGAEEKGAEK